MKGMMYNGVYLHLILLYMTEICTDSQSYSTYLQCGIRHASEQQRSVTDSKAKCGKLIVLVVQHRGVCVCVEPTNNNTELRQILCQVISKIIVQIIKAG